MASRAVVVVPHQQVLTEGGKLKNVAAEGRNRRVLQDIGNLVKGRAEEGKVHGQKAVLEKNKNNKKPTKEVVESGKITEPKDDDIAVENKNKPVSGRKLKDNKFLCPDNKNKKKPTKEVVESGKITEPKDDDIAVENKNKPISGRKLKDNKFLCPDNKNNKNPTKEVVESGRITEPKDDNIAVENKNKPISGRKLKEAGTSRRKNFNKTFSSTLGARSKVAGGLTKKPKDQLADIDAADGDNELAVVEYIDELYSFYKLSEGETKLSDYMGLQPDINAKMRSILVDWLVEVHNKFELTPETLYLTINIVDRFLSMKVVLRRELQLVGISSMLLASKYEEIWAPEVNDFVCISDNAYVKEHILAMEKAILGKLGWYLTVPTAYVFLVRYTKASVPTDEKLDNMVFFLAELGLMQYSAVTLYGPSIIAASATYAARCTLDKKPFWTETLKHHTGYSEDQLMDCAKLLVSFHSAAAESKLKAVFKKFSSPKCGAVALHSPAKTLLED